MSEREASSFPYYSTYCLIMHTFFPMATPSCDVERWKGDYNDHVHNNIIYLYKVRDLNFNILLVRLWSLAIAIQ